jgi:DNA-binding response OmpR family regulator
MKKVAVITHDADLATCVRDALAPGGIMTEMFVDFTLEGRRRDSVDIAVLDCLLDNWTTIMRTVRSNLTWWDFPVIGLYSDTQLDNCRHAMHHMGPGFDMILLRNFDPSELLRFVLRIFDALNTSNT